MESRQFVIPVRRRWTLWILPTIAILYFLAVIILVILGERVRGVDTEMLVLAGVGLFVLVFLIELPFLLRRRAKIEEDAPPAYEPMMAAAPAEMAERDDEVLVTDESQKGLRVLEYSRPAKTVNKGAVYAKTYVPVTKEFVLRVETLAADRTEV